MYTRGRRETPVWWIILLASLMTFGGCMLWRGLTDFLSSAGDITAPVTQAAAATAQRTPNVPTPDVEPLNLVFRTPPTPRPCLDFYVTAVRARIRQCPNERCETLKMPYQGNKICVFGPAKDAPDWYEVNAEPQQAIPLLGYMHQSVIAAMNPTPRPTRTPRPSATPRPSRTPTAFPTVTPLPTVTLSRSGPLPTPSPTLGAD